MAAKLYYQEDCNLSVLEGQTIAIIGYGRQEFCYWWWELSRQVMFGSTISFQEAVRKK